tara:strand:+ start:559 stop:1314 length:756 start_codon:yes stop_codon:yes gene_type:complete
MINVDNVYKTVLLILNKEQRGYMTPDEFNKIGAQVQNEIFEGYFNDMNQYLRQPQTDFDYSDRAEYMDEKIAQFKKEGTGTHTSGGIFTLPTDIYRLGSVTYTGGTNDIELQKVGRKEFYNIQASKLTAASEAMPIFLQEDNSITTHTKIIVLPSTIGSGINVQYLRKPTTGSPTWAYTVDDTSQGYIYAGTSTGSTVTPTTGVVDFDLHASEQHEVIKRILLYAGVVIKDPIVLQTMTSELAKDKQMDKS